jgi:hypothetical protein
MRMTAAEKNALWKEMLKEEPALQLLMKELRAVKDDKKEASFCANRLWLMGWDNDPLSSPKRKIEELVGWHAQNPVLRTEAAYRLAYEKLYDVLPNCRNCWCIGQEPGNALFRALVED